MVDTGFTSSELHVIISAFLLIYTLLANAVSYCITYRFRWQYIKETIIKDFFDFSNPAISFSCLFAFWLILSVLNYFGIIEVLI